MGDLSYVKNKCQNNSGYPPFAKLSKLLKKKYKLRDVWAFLSLLTNT